VSDSFTGLVEIRRDQMTYAPKNFTVWSEIPVTSMDRAMAFYNAVCDADLTLDHTGPNPVAMFKTDDENAVCGHLYEGKPAGDGSGPTVHLAAPGTLEEIIARIWDAGGKVISPPIAIPAGRFAYALDPDGNSIGFFEMASV
jgi:predicted enzyme related to lactoylglutathione lyase